VIQTVVLLTVDAHDIAAVSAAAAAAAAASAEIELGTCTRHGPKQPANVDVWLSDTQ
jgi:hypothetical protein